MNNVMIGAVKAKKIKPPKYTYGDMVYGWENPDKPGKIFRIMISDDPEIDHKYKLTLKDKKGFTYSSEPVSEKYLSNRKKKK